MLFQRLTTDRKGQTALEYIILLTLVAVVVIIAFNRPGRNGLLEQTQHSTEGYFNDISQVIMGDNPVAVAGKWCDWKSPINGVVTRECACPRPKFGGAYCIGPAHEYR